MKKIIFCFLSVFLTLSTISKAQSISMVEPPLWWAGMENSKLQIMVYGPNISATTLDLKSNLTGVTILGAEKVENPNYLFVNLDIAKDAQTGMLNLNFIGKKKIKYAYEIRKRNIPDNVTKGFGPEDVIYLIMPDRFANGDLSNDIVKGMQETTIERSNPKGRHGGDLRGIINNLNYLKELGITTLWLNPALENDQPKESYHGYAATNLYKIDKRLGSNETYLELVNKAQAMGIKVIMDIVHNHVGNRTWWFLDLPEQDWVHQFDSFTRTTYKAETKFDQYASNYDRTLMENGWFDRHMPDLNQKNPKLSTYLIQNNIWWIEYAKLNGYRLDTYVYPDNDFVTNAFKAIKTQYPDFGLVGEVWVQPVGTSGYYTDGSPFLKGKRTYMPGVTDFPLYDAIKMGLNEDNGWNTGLSRIYYTLTQDFVYGNPNYNVTFLDNHDISRISSEFKGDINKLKLAYGFMLTTRGIPQVFYGTELMMQSYADPDAKVRIDFPGGWPGDKLNKFTAEGRSPEENEMFNFMKTLNNWRKTASAVHTGKLTHFVPQNNAYVYFRYNDAQTIMVIMHTGKSEQMLPLARFSERTSGFTKGKNVLNGETILLGDALKLQPNTITILELSR